MSIVKHAWADSDGVFPAMKGSVPSGLSFLGCNQQQRMQAFHLGEDGTMAPQRVAECTHLPSSAGSGGAGSENTRGRSNGSARRAPPRVERLVVLPVATSTRAHAIAITVDAKRVFLALDVKRRALKCVFVKPSDGLAAAGARSGARPAVEGLVATVGGNTMVVAAPATADGALSSLLAVLPNPGGACGPTRAAHVVCMLYCMANLALFVKVVSNHGSEIIAPTSAAAMYTNQRNRACAANEAPTAAGTAPPPPRATELVYDAHAYVPGEVKVIEQLPQRSAFSPFLAKGLADEAMQQLWLPPPRFAVMSTSGVLEVTRRRPLEVLKVSRHALLPTAVVT